jgi:hypothetical protein
MLLRPPQWQAHQTIAVSAQERGVARPVEPVKEIETTTAAVVEDYPDLKVPMLMCGILLCGALGVVGFVIGDETTSDTVNVGLTIDYSGDAVRFAPPLTGPS